MIDNVLIQQKTEVAANTGNICTYNIYYNSDLTKLDDNPLPNKKEDLLISMRQSPNKASMRRQTPMKGSMKQSPMQSSMNEEELAQLSLQQSSLSNYVKIDVDINELRKYAPNINPTNSEDLLAIASELTNSIQVGQDGKILVNTGKLNLNCLHITDKNLQINLDNKKDHLDSSSLINHSNDRRKVLYKTIKLYQEEKYLLVINHIERLARNTNSVYIHNKNTDQIFEDYDVFIEISSICLSNKDNKKVIWELSLFEAKNLTDQHHPSEIARFFGDHLVMYGDRFLFASKKNINFTITNNSIIVKDSVIRMIQNRFKNKRFNENYAKFYKFLKPFIKLKKILHRDVITINKVLQLIAFENEDNRLEIDAWDLDNYDKYVIEIAKESLPKAYNKNKEEIIKIIFKNLNFDYISNSHVGLTLKHKSLLEAFSKIEPVRDANTR